MNPAQQGALLSELVWQCFFPTINAQLVNNTEAISMTNQCDCLESNYVGRGGLW